MYQPNIVELTQIKYRVLRLLPFTSLLSVLTLLSYFACRIIFIITSRVAGGQWSVVANSILVSNLLPTMRGRGNDRYVHRSI